MILQCDHAPCGKLWSGSFEKDPEEWTEIDEPLSAKHQKVGPSFAYCRACGNETFEIKEGTGPSKVNPSLFNVFAYLDQQEKQEIKKGNARLLLVTDGEERDLELTPDDVLDFCPDEWREQYDLLCQAVYGAALFNPDMEIDGVLNIMEEQLARIKRTRR